MQALRIRRPSDRSVPDGASPGSVGVEGNSPPGGPSHELIGHPSGVVWSAAPTTVRPAHNHALLLPRYLWCDHQGDATRG